MARHCLYPTRMRWCLRHWNSSILKKTICTHSCWQLPVKLSQCHKFSVGMRQMGWQAPCSLQRFFMAWLKIFQGSFTESFIKIHHKEACQDSTYPPSLFLESWRTWMFLMELEMVSWYSLYPLEALLKITLRYNNRNLACCIVKCC